jgi:hypothetical protein
MLIQALAAANFALGAFDAYITKMRIEEYGPKVEINALLKWMATRLGPAAGAVIGVMLPTVGWTMAACALNWPVLLAFWVGFNCKRVETQLVSLWVLRHMQAAQKLIEDYKKSGGSGATLPPGETTPKESPDIRKY